MNVVPLLFTLYKLPLYPIRNAMLLIAAFTMIITLNSCNPKPTTTKTSSTKDTMYREYAPDSSTVTVYYIHNGDTSVCSPMRPLE